MNADRIYQLERDLAVAKSDITQVKNDIKEIKDTMNKFNNYLLNTMGTTILSLIGIVVTIVIALKK